MYQYVILPYFRRQLKAYAKKYRHIQEAVLKTLKDFRKETHPHLGRNVYKVRLKTKDVPRGKSDSFRLLVFVIEADGYIVPLALYFKGDKEDMSRKELNTHLTNIILELRMRI